jgi:hypothetical protein
MEGRRYAAWGPTEEIQCRLTCLGGGGEPGHVGVEEEEDDHADGHDVHVNAEDDSGVVVAPAGLHAADGVEGAEGGDQSGEDEEEVGAVVGEVGEEKGGGEGEQDQRAGADQRVTAQIEEILADGREVVLDGERERHGVGRVLHLLRIGSGCDWRYGVAGLCRCGRVEWRKRGEIPDGGNGHFYLAFTMRPWGEIAES